ncbi:IniB N-terminal domain-containing protein [Kutzneria buriramensis]|uniref:Uncharacterized protein n=1 Tax=Kutzneria buriramensis TaxID=1045776 RepID=A0A3E0HQB2_9PSEU|nr:IniB N-terminal domain-containing protein [Kutzneria buriramensis]REH48589.1 hypothetical protein BCF44_105448 [Kutzneria buriramensis]
MAQTLHEFTLGLVRDEQLRSLFAADPAGVLQSAGLGDITAADVHEILPLVLDYAPTPVVEAFEQSIGGGLPSLPGGDAVSTLQELTQHLTSIAPALPVDSLPGLPTAGLPTAGLPSLPGLSELPIERSLPTVPGLGDVTGALPLPGLDAVTGALPIDGALPSLPIDGAIPALPIDGAIPALPLDGVTGALPAVPGLPTDALSDPTALVGDVRSAVADPGRAAYGVQSMTEQIVQGAPAVAAHGLPVAGLLGGAGLPGLGAAGDVTKTLDTTVHSATGVAGNVPVAGKLVADTTGHVTGAVHSVDVDGVAKTAAGLTDITKIANGDPIHAVTNIGDVSHTLDTINSVTSSVHGDQVLQHVSGCVDAGVKDLNIGNDNHVGIGDINLGGVHVGDVTHNLDAHLPGF